MNKGYEDLLVWQKSINLAEKVYFITNSFPSDEIYGLTSQVRRSAVSIASNIAEGCSRNSKKDFLRFVFIALGSVAELKTQFIIAKRVGYLEEKYFVRLSEYFVEIEKMLHGLRKSLLATNNSQLAT
ncbi:MAG: four helix bundle protein [Alphaproteobacteria bacterium CG11_big_fil_rev_8_21_14_0_20_39_49]|nr:MAG: four helix bundle protein [Alphaproteobacteria bacterium CG11_big_fil_rev_8_21_14_0_20_39_49]